jgi:hypothetical protein
MILLLAFFYLLARLLAPQTVITECSHRSPILHGGFMVVSLLQLQLLLLFKLLLFEFAVLPHSIERLNHPKARALRPIVAIVRMIVHDASEFSEGLGRGVLYDLIEVVEVQLIVCVRGEAVRVDGLKELVSLPV